MIVGIDHLQLAMPPGGEDEAVRFYGDVLGLTPIPKPAVLAVRGGCWFDAGTVQIHLGGDATFVPARKAHPAFAVTDLDSLLARLAEAGIEVRDGAVIDGRIQRFCDDPFGNRIELVAV